MATETVALDKQASMKEIYRELLGIEALAQILQKAFEVKDDAADGVYGTACIIEQMAQRAQKLTGV